MAGNFSVFWKALTLAVLLFVAYLISQQGLDAVHGYPAVFAFGLVAFGLLGMGPVTIAVDSYGPVTDNAQSIFELSQIETTPGRGRRRSRSSSASSPTSRKGKHFLEDNDGAGNTFKATAKPVLIATAVAGATTMIFSIILLLQKHIGLGGVHALDLLEPRVLLGLLMGGAHRLLVHRRLDAGGHHRRLPRGRVHQAATSSSTRPRRPRIEDSKEVVQICTQYAQAGHVQHLHRDLLPHAGVRVLQPDLLHRLPGLDRGGRPVPGRLHGERRRRVGQRQEGGRGRAEREGHRRCTTRPSSATRWAIPYKDTSSVALNPIIKFTTLFGLLAVEIGGGQPGGRACRSAWCCSWSRCSSSTARSTACASER